MKNYGVHHTSKVHAFPSSHRMMKPSQGLVLHIYSTSKLSIHVASPLIEWNHDMGCSLDRYVKSTDFGDPMSPA